MRKSKTSRFNAIAAVIVIAAIIVTVVFGRQADFASLIQQVSPAVTGKSTLSDCAPTRENPRYKCIPRDRNGNVMQLNHEGGALPDEYQGLPTGGGQ